MEPSPVEDGFKAMGRTEDRRALLIVLTLRMHNGETLIRPIKARYISGHRRDRVRGHRPGRRYSLVRH
jgi:uncharacterized DUF497 family protein